MIDSLPIVIESPFGRAWNALPRVARRGFAGVGLGEARQGGGQLIVGPAHYWISASALPG